MLTLAYLLQHVNIKGMAPLGESNPEEIENKFETDKVFFKQEPPAQSLARLDWLRQRHRAELVVFLSREGVAGEIVRKSLAYLEEAHNDIYDFVQVGLDCEATAQLPERHPNSPTLEAEVDRYRDGEEFTLDDYLELNGYDKDAMDGLPQEIVDQMAALVGGIMSPRPWLKEVVDVTLLEDQELIIELKRLD